MRRRRIASLIIGGLAALGAGGCLDESGVNKAADCRQEAEQPDVRDRLIDRVFDANASEEATPQQRVRMMERLNTADEQWIRATYWAGCIEYSGGTCERDTPPTACRMPTGDGATDLGLDNPYL